MMERATRLSTLLAPIEVDTFARTYWERQRLLISRDAPSYYEDLLSLEDVDHLITSTDLRRPAFRMVRQGQPIAMDSYTYDLPYRRRRYEGIAHPGKMVANYREGGTIVLESLHRYWPPIRAFCRGLERELSHPVHSNAYLTPPQAQGFGPHHDPHDQFVLQLEGSKTWRLYEGCVELPHQTQRFQAETMEPGELLETCRIEAGDLLYIPRGVIHEAAATADHSLHITVGVAVLRWYDLFTELAQVCREDIRFRRALPVGFASGREAAPEILRRRFGELLELSSDESTLDRAVDRLTDSFVASRLPVLDGHLLDVAKLAEVDGDTRVRRREPMVFRLIAGGSRVELRFHGKELRFPWFQQSAVVFAAEAEGAFTAKSMPGLLDEETRVALVKVLVREGFLTLWPAAGTA